MEVDMESLENEGRKSTIVVTRDSGVILGNVNCAFIDPLSNKITALSFRRKFLGKEFFLRIDEVESIGVDVLFVSSNVEAHPLTKADQAPGVDLRNFQGMWVYTQSGRSVAAITDLEFDRKTWALETLYFCDDRALKVNREDISIKPDRMLIPDSLADSIFNPGSSQGLLASLFGRDGVEEASIVLRRALQGLTTPSFHAGESTISK